MQIIFKSLNHSREHAYAYDTNWDERFNAFIGRAGQCLGLYHAMYRTGGDGMVQHSPLFVIGREYLEDYCLSLASHIVGNVGALLELDRVVSIGETIPAETAAFLRGVKYKEGKAQWYSVSERKVSASETKQHDKRWFDVPTWADGSLEAAFRLFRASEQNTIGALDILSLAARLDAGEQNTSAIRDLAKISLPEFTAFRRLYEAVNAFRDLYNAKASLDCQLGNIARRQEAEAAPVAAAA